MGGETILPEGDDAALIDGCRRFDAAALAKLTGLDCRHPVARHFIEASFAHDDAARKVLIKLPPGCSVRAEWNRRREPGVARWFENHQELVLRIFRKRLRSFASHIEDGAQDFWLSFQRTGQELLYDSKRASEKTFIGGNADRSAMTTFTSLCREAGAIEPTHVEELGNRQPPPDPFSDSARTRLERRLCRLILTNRLEAHEAFALVASDWAEMKTSEILARFSHHTLLDVCDALGNESGAMQRRDVRDAMEVLRSQLRLPPESPVGNRTLAGLLRERGADSLAELFQQWIDQARRVCRTSLDKPYVESPSEWIGPIEEEVMRDLRNRFDFALSIAKGGIESVKVLVWGWQTILNLKPEMYLGLRIYDASATLARRMRWLLRDYPIPDDFASILSGGHSNETIRAVLDAAGEKSDSIERSLERKFRKFGKGRELRP
jgi:hypothetical protein